MGSSFYNLDDVRNISILDVCEAYGVLVEKQGKSYFCKLRDEKTASCKLNINTRYGYDTFKDFGSGAYGDVITFVQELNDFVIGFCNYVVRQACENTTSGNYYVNIQEALEKIGAGYDDFLEYKDLILSELASREELLEFEYNENDLEFDVNCALAYCPNYEWCEGDEAIFECSYEEWLEKPTEPIVDRPTYSQLIDTNYAQSVVPSVRFYVGDGINIDKDYTELGEALKAFKIYADKNDDICFGIMQRGEAKILLDNIYGSVNLYHHNLKDIDNDIVDELRSYMKEIYPANDFRVGKWRIHVLVPGDKYGLNNCLEFEDKNSCVEFWDMSLDKTRFPEGQFTGGRYYISTLLDDKWGSGPDELMHCGLCLNGDCRDVWSVSGEEMKKVYEWLKNRPLSDGEHYLYCSGEVDVPYDIKEYEFQAQGYLYDTLSSLALSRDVNVEHTGGYDKGNGFTFSFKTQADQGVVEKALNKALNGMNYNLDCEAKKIGVAKVPLDKVIKACAEQVKDEIGSMEKLQNKGVER